MPLSVGDNLGPYEILAQVGAGGMGVVYKARDTRLGRIVAIKTSKLQFTRRFEREARAVAALNHPNICHLYDVGPDYLVMEWVEGENLEGPVPVQEALSIAEQIAEALAAAHEKGIVHRDLKPANIRITQDGSVKVLDFGLAKITPEESDEASEDSPTLSLTATQAGMIVGTASYMAPEQALGKPADHRADVWSFGVVLYEIVTGERPFRGEHTSDVLAAVIKETPDLSRVPARLQPLLKSCLEKDRKKRLQAIGDWKLLVGEAHGPPGSQAGGGLRHIVWPTVAVLTTLVAASISFLHFREAPAAEPVLRASIQFPDKSGVGYFSLSPDARTLAIVSLNSKSQLWLRSLDSLDPAPLANTDRARNPFWSPDGRSLGFFADGKLKTVRASGGPATAVCNAGIGGGGAWNREGVILFGTNDGDRPIQRVNAEGGACTAATQVEPGMRHLLPEFLPDGRHFLYLSLSTDQSKAGLYLASLDQAAGRRLLPDQSSVIFVPRRNGAGRDHLLFEREHTLMAQPFNAETLDLAGDPFPVAPKLAQTLTSGQVAASAAANGTLVYLAGSSHEEYQLTWLNRSGKEIAKAGPVSDQRSLALAPDQKTVALAYRSNSARSGLWLRELSRDVESRFALPPFAGPPAWSPDSKRIVFSGPKGLYVKSASAGSEELLLSSDRQILPTDWSRDGKYLLYSDIDPKTHGDIWVLPLDASGKAGTPAAFLKTESDETHGQFSPDGRWVAYVSNESGRSEIYVRPFPSGGGATKISGNFGNEPRWRDNGEELYYIVPGQYTLMAVSVRWRPTGTPEFGIPKPLFPFQTLNMVPDRNMFIYSPSADGQRFLMNLQPDAEPASLNVITNWEPAAATK